ncbi:MAG: hypothetical protein ACYTG0_25685 [Planctomycetota bacterium]
MDVDNVQSDLVGVPYYEDRPARTGVSFTNDGHLQLNTRTSNKLGEGRSLFIDFGRPITIVDTTGELWTFQTTDDLLSESFQHDANLWVGAGQDNFNMFLMTMGEIREDVNLTITLLLHSPNAPKTEVPVFIKLAPEPVPNDRHCLASDSVSVECTGLDSSGVANEWRVTTPEVDDDGDGLFNEDPIDGINNDGDGLVDEDPIDGINNDGDGLVDEDPIDGINNDGDGLVDEDPWGARAAVSQNPFGLTEDDLTIGICFFSFGMTVGSGVE